MKTLKEETTLQLKHINGIHTYVIKYDLITVYVHTEEDAVRVPPTIEFWGGSVPTKVIIGKFPSDNG